MNPSSPPLGPLPPGCDRPGLLAAVRAGAVGLDEAARAVVAVSGGPDSTALAYLLAEARPDLHLELVHVRHGLRDDAPDRAAVARLAAWTGLPLHTEEVRVVAAGHGRQAAARDARYAALRRVAAEVDATAIVVGHTADDQAETVLLRAARGTGVAGLAAMRVHEGDLVRPLLRVRRVDLRTFLDGEGLRAAHDPSNDDRASRRVRARNEVLPVLGELAGDPVGALGRLAALAADDDAALVAAADAVVDGHAVRVGSTLSVPTSVLAPLPAAVRRRVTRQLLAALGAATPDAATCERVERARPGASILVPDGHEVRVGGGWRCVAAPVDRHAPVAVVPAGTTAWSPAGAWLEVRSEGAVGGAGDRAGDGHLRLDLEVGWVPPAPDPATLLVPPGGRAERCHLAVADLGPTVLRHRAPGDRVATRAGTATVARLLADAGVPGPVRARWPVLVDAADRVLWVPGIAADRAVLAAGRAAARRQLVLRAAAAGAAPTTH